MYNLTIGTHKIGINQPTFFIAELSANHNQDFEIALKTVKAAKESGADAIKLQTLKPELITLDCDNEHFQIKQGTLWDGTTLFKLYKQVYTPWEWQPKLMEYAKSLGLECFSSPFDNSAVDFLADLDVPAYKVASFEITDTPLIEHMASKGKPMIISTGIAELQDITDAIEACHRVGNRQVALLKCTSAYPAPLEEANLLTIPDMIDRFGVVAGLSDHTIGSIAAITAAALGAKIIEKHFILDRKIGGPDSEFSMEPAEFKAMVDTIRDVEKTLGAVNYALSAKLIKSRKFSRSLFVVEDVAKGETFTMQNIRSIRPGDGMRPGLIRDVIGKTAVCDISRGTPLSPDLIEKL
jgi:pseudaminic acid synthase